MYLSKKYKMRLICKYSFFKYTWTSMLFKTDFFIKRIILLCQYNLTIIYYITENLRE